MAQRLLMVLPSSIFFRSCAHNNHDFGLVHRRFLHLCIRLPAFLPCTNIQNYCIHVDDDGPHLPSILLHFLAVFILFLFFGRSSWRWLCISVAKCLVNFFSVFFFFCFFGCLRYDFWVLSCRYIHFLFDILKCVCVYLFYLLSNGSSVMLTSKVAPNGMKWRAPALHRPLSFHFVHMLAGVAHTAKYFGTFSIFYDNLRRILLLFRCTVDCNVAAYKNGVARVEPYFAVQIVNPANSRRFVHVHCVCVHLAGAIFGRSVGQCLCSAATWAHATHPNENYFLLLFLWPAARSVSETGNNRSEQRHVASVKHIKTVNGQPQMQIAK